MNWETYSNGRPPCISICDWFAINVAFDVRLLVEAAKEEIEHDSVHSNPPNKRFGVVALGEEQLERVQHHQHKLDHLEGGEVSFPPEVLLVLWTKSS